MSHLAQHIWKVSEFVCVWPHIESRKWKKHNSAGHRNHTHTHKYSAKKTLTRDTNELRLPDSHRTRFQEYAMSFIINIYFVFAHI